MANIEGMQNKFVVIKRTDVSNFLPPHQQEQLQEILKAIDINRIIGMGDPASINSYLVINTDESYAEDVIDVLKMNGHWESPGPFPIPEGRCIRCGLDNQTDEHIDNCDPDPIERDQD